MQLEPFGAVVRCGFATEIDPRLPPMLRGDPGLVVLEPPLEIPGFTKTAAWHARTHRSAGHQWARELLFELAQGGGLDVE